MLLTKSFFKPFDPPTPILFSTHSQTLDAEIHFRSLDLEKDLSLIHSWVTQPYAEKFWQLNVDPQALLAIYESILSSPIAHSFIGLLDNKIVCQVDLYHVSAEEIREHVPNHPGHCGLHILLCPPRESRRGLAAALLKAFVQFFFSFDEAQALYGEPDAANTVACVAALRAGFQFQKQITLSYKTANLYAITREQFFKSFSNDK
jgi:RimJ/RimL family protein N-acetyltransferase